MVPLPRSARGDLALNRHLRVTLIAASLALAGALALARLAAASWMVPPTPDRPKDFTLLKRSGVYHLFYIRNNPDLPFGETQYDFGHAVSEDLYFWQFRPNVLGRRPGHFDRTHVWAPSIVQRDGVYYMFYTGVSDSGAYELDQRTGIATSTDLEQWNALELPILDCSRVPWAVCDSTNASPFRDPFVMPDPTTPGRWLMYYVTAPASAPEGMIVGVASSAGDFTQWQDLKPLWITHHTATYNYVLESPHVFQHGALWFLFFTTNSGQPISFATSTASPYADRPAWTYRGRLATMLNIDTSGWFASEYFRDGLVDYFTYVNGDRVEISRMVWTAPDRFSLTQPDLFHVKSLAWTTPTVRAGTSATLYIASRWWTGHTAMLECFFIDDIGEWHPVPNDVLGIPTEIPITADLQPFTWVARTLPSSYGAPDSPRIVVRLVDQTATSNVLTVLPEVWSGDPGVDPPPEPSGTDPNGGIEEFTERGAYPILRTLRLGITGSMPSLLVDLDAGEVARLDVFDLQGRRVRTLADRRLEAGAHVVPWDGRDESGRRLGGGVYFARLRTAAAARTVRFFLR